MNTAAKLISGGIAIVVLALGAYFVLRNQLFSQVSARLAMEGADSQTTDATSSPTDDQAIAESQWSGAAISVDTISQTADAPAGYVQYRNTKYGFSFYHLPEGKITEYDEGSGAETVVLENLQKVRGMQVFIVPYDQPLITQERFNEDEPSGVRTDVQDASLDGVRAVTFNSTDITLGETREIWVIRSGYLYEITTFSGVGEWFTPIIQSWRWI